MNVMPQVAPVSQVHKEALAVGAMLTKGPVLLTARSERFGVLVDVDQWNSMCEHVHRMEMQLEALQAALRVERGEEKLVDHEALERKMAAYVAA